MAKVLNKLMAQWKEKSSDHPLGSDGNLDVVIAGLPTDDPSLVLVEVDHWLDEMGNHSAEIGPERVHQAVLRLDQAANSAANELLRRYLSEKSRAHMAESAWAVLNTHANAVFRGHVVAVKALALLAGEGAEKMLMARSAARALRAWAVGKKLQHFRYRPVTSASWQVVHDLMRLLVRQKLLQVPVEAYRGEAETSPMNEYLVGLYLEFVPAGNLIPQQLELFDAFLRNCGGLELRSQPQTSSNYRIDISATSGPRRIAADDRSGSSVRYCSTERLRDMLMKLAAQTAKQEKLPSWLRVLPVTRDQIETGISTLSKFWAPTPPHRSDARYDQERHLKVLLGFDPIRHMIAGSHFALTGSPFKHEGGDPYQLAANAPVKKSTPPLKIAEDPRCDYSKPDEHRLFDEHRFGRLETDAPIPVDIPEYPDTGRYGSWADVPATPAKGASIDSEQVLAETSDDASSAASARMTPLEMLEEFEQTMDQKQMESWLQIDGCSSGLGVVLTSVLPRHRVGILVGFRYLDELDWRIGIVRRIGRDANNRASIGLETLAWPSILAQARPVDKSTGSALSGKPRSEPWTNAIITGYGSKELILPVRTFVTGMEVDVRTEEGTKRVQLQYLLDRGADYDRVEFSRNF